MAKAIPRLQWAYLGVSACGYLVAAVFSPIFDGEEAISEVLRTIYYSTLGLSAASVLFEAMSSGPRGYLSALTVRFICTMVLAPLVAGNLGLELALFGSFTIGICLYNPFPVNLVLSAVVNGLILLIRGYMTASRGLAVRAILEGELEFALFAAALTALAAVMVIYRETLISHQEENERLDILVERLTRVNLNYQEYAKSLEEASIESERKRITRDIHDIVGYTLTNNITMMEAITDMMNINPLGVAHLVKRARTNAQEGLSRVRDALHLLRGQEIAWPTGYRAVERMVRQFELATGVRVEFAFTAVAWEFPEELDSALYHLVQESLVNSFRHGKATLIRLFLARREDALEIKISDNGIGASELMEGIGLAGMRERLARLGGSLSAGPVPWGFEVTASVRMGS